MKRLEDGWEKERNRKEKKGWEKERNRKRKVNNSSRERKT